MSKKVEPQSTEAKWVVIEFRGRVRTVSAKGYACLYVYRQYGGKDLARLIGQEIEGFIIIRTRESTQGTSG